jgi:sulfate adenylyltransferase
VEFTPVVSEVNSPYGGRLVERVRKHVPEELRKVEIPKRYALDAEKIAVGAFSPLEGFMGSGEVESVLERGTLESGLPWTIPIILPLWRGLEVEVGEEILLTHGSEGFAVMTVEETFRLDRRRFAERVYGTLDPAHPGVRQTMEMSEFAVSGSIELVKRITGDRTPREVREEISKFGWKTVAGYQTRNPPHRAHEYVIRTAMELVDGVLIHPVVGELKTDDFPPEVIVESYKVFIDEFLPKRKVLFDTLNIAMRYAGPKAAVFLAIIRKNFGCTHFVVGRDMAGVGSYYDPYGAQKALKELDLGIEVIALGEAFYCRRCDGVVSERNCDHDGDLRVKISMTQVRRMLSQGVEPPREMIRPEVLTILKRSFERSDSSLKSSK